MQYKLCILAALGAPAVAFRAGPRTARRATLAMKADNTPYSYTELLRKANNQEVERALISPDASQLTALDTDGDRHPVQLLENDKNTVRSLIESGVDVFVQPPQQSPLGFVGGLLANPFTLLFLFLVLPNIIRSVFGGGPGMAGGPGGMMGGGGPMGQLSNVGTKVEEKPDARFGDVAGCEEAKRELTEVVDFLKSPSKYTRLGAQLPRGVLLEGPPGTGKTLIARSLAGEADAKFISVSGSEFVEMFVGVGASRVRNLFQEARKNAPCVVFIDEIDAVGGRRGSGVSNGNDEREQTLNQILTEMDGFKSSDGVLVVAATNRKDTLDPALLRPGRFDRQVNVDLPDKVGREAILKVHARGRPLDETISLNEWAGRTVGFSGAQLRNLLNEGSMLAARRNGSAIQDLDIRSAFEKVVVGIRKDTDTRDERTRSCVAYHEAGHAVTGMMLNTHPNVSYVTIRPTTSGAGGFTMFEASANPDSDGGDELPTKEALLDRMVVMLGGRAAEQIIYGKDGVTPGASQDLTQASDLARRLVSQWGLSEVGPLGQGQQDPYSRSVRSSKMADKVEQTVLDLVAEANERAVVVLKENKRLLDAMAVKLLKGETLAGFQVKALCNDEEVPEGTGLFGAEPVPSPAMGSVKVEE